MSADHPTFTGPGGADPFDHLISIANGLVPTEGDLLNAGHLLRAQIRDRTFRGVDANGAPFTGYSAAYAKRKMARGRSGTVDLFGAEKNAHMLDGMTVKAGSAKLDPGQEPAADVNASPAPANLIQVGFYESDQAVRARVHNEGGTVRTRLGKGKGKPKKGGVSSFSMPRRHFFDANREDIALMTRAIGERIMSRIRNK